MKLAAVQIKTNVLELLRYPSFSIPALLFPSVLFLVLGRAYTQPAVTRLAGFAAVAILGVVFFQFGVGIASDRVSSWEAYLRTLPAGPRLRIAVRVCAALAIASVAAAGVVVVALASTSIQLSPVRWLALVAALLVGSVPFGLLGIAIGYVVRPRAALPVANLLYLPLSYAGGLWGGPSSATGRANRKLDVIPTHDWAAVLWASVGARSFDATAAGVLVGWAIVFGLVAVWAYRRDEGERFS